MRLFIRRLLTVLLCLSMILPCIGIAAQAEEIYGTNIPTIYITGLGNSIYTFNEDGSIKEKIYPVEVPADYIMSQVTKNTPHFIKAIATKNFDIIADDIYESMKPYFEELALDENGEPKSGSGCDWDWTEEEIKAETLNGQYPLRRYYFNYDWRLDPYTNAQKLHDYVEGVCKKIGCKEVNMLGRCLGSNVMAAYMEKYNGEYVRECIFYCPALYGVTLCSALLSGEIYFDDDCLDMYLQDQTFGEENLTNLVKSFVTMFNKVGGLDLTASQVNYIYKNVLKSIAPKVMRDTLATFPGMWSMVSDRYYEQAKSLVFADNPDGKYDNFIKIIDNYHYNVQVNAPKYLKELEKSGVEMNVITKYGYASFPVAEESREICDSTSTVADSSFGAVDCKFGETLPDSYIEEAVSKGNGKYISPDKQIDASTCLFPDNTWIVKNIEHSDFPDSIDLLQKIIFNNDGFDINTDPSYPQYLVYDQKTEEIAPMTEKNMNTEGRYKKSFLRTVWDFLVSLWDLIKSKIS